MENNMGSTVKVMPECNHLNGKENYKNQYHGVLLKDIQHILTLHKGIKNYFIIEYKISLYLGNQLKIK